MADASAVGGAQDRVRDQEVPAVDLVAGDRTGRAQHADTAVQQHQPAQGRDRGARTARPTCWPWRKARRSGRPRTSSTPSCPASRRPAAPPEAVRTTSRARPGNMAVAEKYMKAAGYPSGKYTGSATVTIVGSNSDPGPQEMQIVQNGLQRSWLQDHDQGRRRSRRCTRSSAAYVKAHDQRRARRPAGSRTSPTRTRRCSCRSAARPSSRSTTPTGPVLNDPKVNDGDRQGRRDRRTRPSSASPRSRNVDKMIVDDAPAVPEVWVKQRPGRGLERPRCSRRLERRLEPVASVPKLGSTTETIDPTGASLRRGPRGNHHRHGPLHNPPPALGHRAADRRQRGHVPDLLRASLRRSGGDPRREVAEPAADRADPPHARSRQARVRPVLAAT